MRADRKGLTLAELVVAFGLMTLILLASIQLFTYLLASGGKTTANLVAMNLATMKLEEEVSGVSAGGAGTIKAYTLDPASNTFRIRLVLDNRDRRLPAGLRCRADFEGSDDDRRIAGSPADTPGTP